MFKVLQLCLHVIMECSFDYLKCLAFGKYIENYFYTENFLCGCMHILLLLKFKKLHDLLCPHKKKKPEQLPACLILLIAFKTNKRLFLSGMLLIFQAWILAIEKCHETKHC